MEKKSVILSLETSCDDTSASVVKDGKVLSNVIYNQLVHSSYGGVVPELASRAHQKNIITVVQEALELSETKLKDLNAIAFTQGPGLMGSLLVDVSFAKGLSLGLGIPLIAVNHLHAHILANFIDEPVPEFPFLSLLVSGGHTQIMEMINFKDLVVHAKTNDDAVGEAFDKAAKILGLPYPGGPMIDQYAKEGNPNKFKFPQPKIKDNNYSFSGLKTAFLYFIRDNLRTNKNFTDEYLNDICASYQNTLIDYLLKNFLIIMEKVKVKNVVLAGGVAANSLLRSKLKDLSQKNDWKLFVPKMEYCTDNAAMIGIAAHYKFLNNEFVDLSVLPFTRN